MTAEQEYQAAYQDFKDAGFSDWDAAQGARQRVANAQAQVQSALANGGGFIGDPFQPGSNVFVPNARANTATGVVPAGTANNLPGLNPASVSAWGDQANDVMVKPSLLSQTAIAGLQSIPGIPKERVDAAKRDIVAAAAAIPEAAKLGASIEDVYNQRLLPAIAGAKNLETEYKYASRAKFRPLKTADGGWSLLDPSTGEVHTLIEGNNIPMQYRTVVSALGSELGKAMSGIYGDPNSPEVQAIITSSVSAMQEVRNKIDAERAINKVPTKSGAMRVRRYNPATRTFE